MPPSGLGHLGTLLWSIVKPKLPRAAAAAALHKDTRRARQQDLNADTRKRWDSCLKCLSLRL
jgi:hypothetical protein